jgi:hypothetical protein
MALNVLFWVFLVCVFAAMAVPCFVLFIIAGRRGWRWMKWLGGVSSVMIFLGAICGFGLLIYGFTHPSSETSDAKDIRETFVHNFGFEPGADFLPDHQQIYCLGDFGCMHLKFQAAAATFDKIRGLGFETISSSSFMAETGGQRAPDWWIKTNELSGVCFQNPKWKGTFSSNVAYLFYDQASQRVYFYSQGID